MLVCTASKKVRNLHQLLHCFYFFSSHLMFNYKLLCPLICDALTHLYSVSTVNLRIEFHMLATKATRFLHVFRLLSLSSNISETFDEASFVPTLLSSYEKCHQQLEVICMTRVLFVMIVIALLFSRWQKVRISLETDLLFRTQRSFCKKMPFNSSGHRNITAVIDIIILLIDTLNYCI